MLLHIGDIRSNIFNDITGERRSAMDDLESLVYSIWYVSSMPMCPSEGRALLYSSWEGKAEQRVLVRIEKLYFA